MIFRPLSKDFRKFSKIVMKTRQMFSNIFQEFLKISKDVRRLPKTFKKTRRCFDDTPTNLCNLRVTLDVSEIIDKCEVIISSRVRIAYRFYQFVTTRYTTDFYIIIIW